MTWDFENAGPWWAEPKNLANLVRHMWLFGVLNDVEDVLSVLDHPEFFEPEFERMIEVLA